MAIATLAALGVGNIGFMLPFRGMPAASIGITMAIVALAIVGAIVICLARFVQRRTSWVLALIAFPAFWTGIEYITSLASPNGTVGSFAYTQASVPPLIQSASLFGIWSITFLICLVASGIALALHNRAKAMPILVLITTVFTTNLVFGIIRLHSSPSNTLPTRVAVIVKDQPPQRFQSNGPTWLAITTAYANEVHAVVSSNPRISTIVLPEKLAILEPQWHNTVTAPLAQAAHDNNVRIVAGFEDDASPGHNIAITFEPNGTTATYEKRHLLASENNLASGNKPGLLGNGMIVEICKDMDFPQMIRTDVTSQHVAVVFVPAEDSNVNGFDILHARVASLDGVEDGFSVVRSARKGDLTISDNRGRMLTQVHSVQSQFTARVVTVPIDPDQTLYSEIGDVFAWACLGLSVVCIAAAALSNQNAKHKA